MKLFISILVLTLIAGAAALLWPQSQSKFNAEISINDNALVQRTAIAQTAPITTAELTTTSQTVPTKDPSLTTPTVANSTTNPKSRFEPERNIDITPLQRLNKNL